MVQKHRSTRYCHHLYALSSGIYAVRCITLQLSARSTATLLTRVNTWLNSKLQSIVSDSNIQADCRVGLKVSAKEQRNAPS
jgi:hypothetical protein